MISTVKIVKSHAPIKSILSLSKSTRHAKKYGSISFSRLKLLRRSVHDNSTRSVLQVLQTETVGRQRQQQDGIDLQQSLENFEMDHEKWYPLNWKEQLANFIEMRKFRTAPVDMMGCDFVSDASAEPQNYRYQVLLTLLLSTHTTYHMTTEAMIRLQEHGCTPANILATSDKDLYSLIKPVGFGNRKVKYIKRTTEMLEAGFNGDIPDTIPDLMSLPGVGDMTAHITMKVAWGQVVGMEVDTHVHRVSNRLGWVQRTTRSPEGTRKALEEWLPRAYWSEVKNILVGVGQQTCHTAAPLCGLCLNRTICPASLGVNPFSPKEKTKKSSRNKLPIVNEEKAEEKAEKSSSKKQTIVKEEKDEEKAKKSLKLKIKKEEKTEDDRYI